MTYGGSPQIMHVEQIGNTLLIPHPHRLRGASRIPLRIPLACSLFVCADYWDRRQTVYLLLEIYLFSMHSRDRS